MVVNFVCKKKYGILFLKSLVTLLVSCNVVPFSLAIGNINSARRRERFHYTRIRKRPCHHKGTELILVFWSVGTRGLGAFKEARWGRFFVHDSTILFVWWARRHLLSRHIRMWHFSKKSNGGWCCLPLQSSRHYKECRVGPPIQSKWPVSRRKNNVVLK